MLLAAMAAYREIGSDKRGLSQAGLADKVSVPRNTAHRWMNGAIPEQKYQRLLELLLGVPVESWMTDEDRAEIQAFAQKVAA